jgi:hypothetical protein
LIIYGIEISDQISERDIDIDFVVALHDNGKGDLSEEIPKEGVGCF